MNSTPSFSTSLHCTASELSLEDSNGITQVSTTLSFSDDVEGHFVELLMPLALAVRVTFLAKPTNPDRPAELGSVVFQTQANQSIYTASLTVSELRKLGLSSTVDYQLSALVRVGNAPLGVPSLMRGYIEEFSGSPHSHAETILVEQEQLTEAIALKPKMSRRKPSSESIEAGV